MARRIKPTRRAYGEDQQGDGMSWYRSLTPDGKLWAETSNPNDDYLVHTDPDTPMTFEKLVTRTVQEWVPWEPGELGPHPSTLDGD